MSASPDFYQHTSLLHDNLREFVGRSAVQVAPGQLLGSGLLVPRTLAGESQPFRPRLIIASGLARIVRDVIDQEVNDNLFVIGAARDNDPTTAIGALYVTCPGLAKDMLKNADFEDGDIVRLSHSTHIAEPERLDPEQATLFQNRICERLGQLRPA